jgi:hypothetical protein
VKRDHHVGHTWWAPLAELDYQRSRRRREKAARAAEAALERVSMHRDTPEGVLRVARAVALWAIALVITVASAASFAESYRGLFVWALHHGLAGFWAAAFPLQVDSFIGVGELVLFIATVDRWTWQHRAGAWAVALLGLAVSVAGNIGHVAAHDAQSRCSGPACGSYTVAWPARTSSVGTTVGGPEIRHAQTGFSRPPTRLRPARRGLVSTATCQRTTNRRAGACR